MIDIARESKTTTIDSIIWKEFKIKCIEKGVTMNDVLEAFMTAFNANKISPDDLGLAPQEEK